MKIQHDREAFESQLPPTTHEFGLKSSPIAFKILSDGLYKNKILAVIRELCCNAYDAHVAAGKEKEPFNLHLPTDVDPVFRVEDFGVGLPPRGEGSVEELYTTYFESTKRDSNKFIGALGLGSKSPFAYTNNFTVKTRWNGDEHTFICCVDHTYRPNITEVGSCETDQPNGLTVEFAVKPSDFSSFYTNAVRVFKYWAKNRWPKLTGGTIHFEEPRVSEYHGVKWFVEKGLKHPIAIMGNVAYPVSIKEANLQLSPIAQFLLESGLVYRFKLGEVNFAPSREDLSYDGITSVALVKAAETAAKELLEKMSSELKTATSLQNFMEKVSALVTSLGYQLGKEKKEIVDFLIKARASDKFKYNDVELSLHELLRDRWYILEAEGHSHRGMYQYWDSYNYRDVVTMIAVGNDPLKVDGYTSAKWIKPKLLVADRKGPATRELAARLEEWDEQKLKYFTYHVFSIRHNPIFVVDDMKSGASQKAAAFKRHTCRPVYMLLTDIESDNHDALVARLKAQLVEKFGSQAPEVVKASNLTDHRPPQDRVKKPKFNTTRVTLVEEKHYGSGGHSFRPLFGTKLNVDAKDIAVRQSADFVKFSEATGYYVVRSGSSLYWDLKCDRKISDRTLRFLVAMNKLKLTDTIFALTPKEVEKHVVIKKAKLKPLEDIYIEALSTISTDDIKYFHTFEQMAQISLFTQIDRLRSGLSKNGKRSKKDYVKLLRALATYRRKAPKTSPLNMLLDEAKQAQRELTRSDSSTIWKYMLYHVSTDFYIEKTSVKKKSLDVEVEKELLKHYPLMTAVDYYNVELVHLIEYAHMMDERQQQFTSKAK